MKLLAVCHMFPPHHPAGSEMYMLAILRGLVARGHDCKVLCAESPEEHYWIDGVEVFRPPEPDPWRSAFFQGWFEWCDVAITHLNCTGIAMQYARECSKPLAHLVHNTFQLKVHNVRSIRAQLLIFNSEWVRDETPMNPSIVAHPIVEPEHYRVERPNPQTVTFINLTVTKGALVFYEMARRFMDVPFVGVKGAYGDQHIIPDTLPNLTIVETTPDILPIYANTKVILMPSDYESYGRVAVEAACSGIPSIVHPTPGLKEALGPAGIYVDRNNIDGWEIELRRLLEDPVYYAERSAAALELGKSLEPEKLLDLIESSLEIVKLHGLNNTAATYDALGKELYNATAKADGHFDPARESAGYRPSLGGVSMRRHPFTSDRQIYLDSKGQPVDASSKDKQILFLGTNTTISYNQALEMGIIDTAGIPFYERYEAQTFEGPAEKQAFDEPAERKVTDRLVDVSQLVPAGIEETAARPTKRRRQA